MDGRWDGSTIEKRRHMRDECNGEGVEVEDPLTCHLEIEPSTSLCKGRYSITTDSHLFLF